MGYFRTIFFCLAGAGALIGYLGMAGDMGRFTWDGLQHLGLVMLWAGCLGVVLGLFVSEIPDLIRGWRRGNHNL